MIDRSTISYETFVGIPIEQRESLKHEIVSTFGLQADPGVLSIEDNTHRYEGKYSGYALCIGSGDITKKTFGKLPALGVSFSRSYEIDEGFTASNHSFFKRGDESCQETIERLRSFCQEGGKVYCVKSSKQKLLGTLLIDVKGSMASIFSFIIDENWRQQGVSKGLLMIAHKEMVDQGVRSIWAKTKNKYVHLLMTRGYKGHVLWKEIYY